MPENMNGPVIAPARNVDSFIDVELIPENGIGIHVAGGFEAYYVAINKELILGRQADTTSESALDLSEMGAYGMGVSRRHAMIRRTASGYEVIDLSSGNGTWLNAERLVPNKPYSFPSGSQLRMGQMRLLIVYPTVPNSRTTNLKD